MFDWKKFIDLGNKLLNEQDEEYVRTAIGRFYYGLFGVLRRYLINVRHKYYLLSKGAWVHASVYVELKNSDDINERQVSKILNKLRKVRNQSDYDSHLDIFHFVKFIADNKKDLEIAFDAIDYFKSHPGY
ncbi:hypothetical protein [Methanobrevibacter sp.]